MTEECSFHMQVKVDDGGGVGDDDEDVTRDALTMAAL
jgi:hypothetical protein